MLNGSWDEDEDASDDFYADDEGLVYCVVCGRDVEEPDYNDYIGMCIDCSEE